MATASTLSFRINYARIQTELHLTEKESTSAKSELYDLLQSVLASMSSSSTSGRRYQTGIRGQVDIYELSQRFSSDHLNEALEAKNAELLNGALLSAIVELINKRKLFGDMTINFETCLFEIYDPTLEDFIVLLNRSSPVPNEASIRVKINSIQDVFNYDYSKAASDKTVKDSSKTPAKVSAKKKKKSNKATSKSSTPAGAAELSISLKRMSVSEDDDDESSSTSISMSAKKQPSKSASRLNSSSSSLGISHVFDDSLRLPSSTGGRGGRSFGPKSSHPGRIYVFTNSKLQHSRTPILPPKGFNWTQPPPDERESKDTSSRGGSTRGGTRGRGRNGRDKGRGRNWRMSQVEHVAPNTTANTSANSSRPSVPLANKFPALTRAQVSLFKDIMRALRNEHILRELDRESRRLHRATDRKQVDKPAQWFERRLIDTLWAKVVTQVASPPKFDRTETAAAAPDPIYLIAKYQQLYHLCVCVRYLGAMQRATSYLEASQIFELFNFIHGKVMGVFYQLEDMHIKTKCVCGICGRDSVAIIAARTAFRVKLQTGPMVKKTADKTEATEADED